jgi:hypothetical protein
VINWKAGQLESSLRSTRTVGECVARRTCCRVLVQAARAQHYTAARLGRMAHAAGLWDVDPHRGLSSATEHSLIKYATTGAPYVLLPPRPSADRSSTYGGRVNKPCLPVRVRTCTYGTCVSRQSSEATIIFTRLLFGRTLGNVTGRWNRSNGNLAQRVWPRMAACVTCRSRIRTGLSLSYVCVRALVLSLLNMGA